MKLLLLLSVAVLLISCATTREPEYTYQYLDLLRIVPHETQGQPMRWWLVYGKLGEPATHWLLVSDTTYAARSERFPVQR